MKLAVLIDAENISSKYIEVILSEANALGNVIYKRIYGNWTTTNMNAWKKAILDNAIHPIQQYSNTTGKNASDSSLIIDAMDLLYLGKLNGFCIVSSDSDFTRLASRLRESEVYVLGMGEKKTPRSFISACNKFSYLDILYAASKKQVKPEEPQMEEPDSDSEHRESSILTKKELQQILKTHREEDETEEKAGSNIQAIKLALQELAEENSDDDGLIFSGKLGDLLNKQFPDFDVRNFGYRKFVPFVNSLKLFETIRSDANSKVILFRLK